jgi:GNAT superfamily N-acetyltransferase
MAAQDNLSPKQFKATFKFTHAERGYSGYHEVEARHKGQTIGNITWDPEKGRVNMVHVDEEHRRKGVATSLWHEANRVAWDKGLTPPKHDSPKNMSADGLAWRKSVN